MPQIDIASFMYQVLTLLLFLLFFFFYLDKIILYFFFDIKKLRFFIVNSNNYWTGYLIKYDNVVNLLQYNNLINNVYFFLLNNLKYLNLLINWIFSNIRNLIITCSLEYNYITYKYLIFIENYSFFDFLIYFNKEEEDFSLNFLSELNDIVLEDYLQYFYMEDNIDFDSNYDDEYTDDSEADTEVLEETILGDNNNNGLNNK